MTTPYLFSSPLLGASRATEAQMIAWLSRRDTGEYSDYDIGQIVRGYVRQCAPVGVDATIVVAQLIHETGHLSAWWAQRERRNPAGIGVTGEHRPTRPDGGAWAWNPHDGNWQEGVSFATWIDDAIPAHIGRLLAYALTDAEATPLQLALIRKALSYRPLTQYRGQAKRIADLRGRWAVPGTNYPQKLVEFANALRVTS